jgi:hypothetical protein
MLFSFLCCIPEPTNYSVPTREWVAYIIYVYLYEGKVKTLKRFQIYVHCKSDVNIDVYGGYEQSEHSLI